MAKKKEPRTAPETLGVDTPGSVEEAPKAEKAAEEKQPASAEEEAKAAIAERTTTISSYISQPPLSSTEIDVLKKAYGLGKDGRQHSLTSISTGQQLPTEGVRLAEASGLVTLKLETKILEWLEAKAEIGSLSDGELKLLEAIKATDPENPKPFVFKEDPNEKGPIPAATVPSASGTGIQPDQPPASQGVGDDHGELPPVGGGEEKGKEDPPGPDEENEKADIEDKSKSTPLRDAIGVLFTTSRNSGELEKAAQERLKGAKTSKVCVSCSEFNRHPHITTMVVTDVKISQAVTKRIKIIAGGRLKEMEHDVWHFLNSKKRSYTFFDLKTWFNPTDTRIHYVVTIGIA